MSDFLAWIETYKLLKRFSVVLLMVIYTASAIYSSIWRIEIGQRLLGHNINMTSKRQMNESFSLSYT